MGDSQSVEAPQLLVYIGQSRHNSINAGNGREVHFDRVLNVKVDVYCRITNEVFEYLGYFLARMSFVHAQSP